MQSHVAVLTSKQDEVVIIGGQQGVVAHFWGVPQPQAGPFLGGKVEIAHDNDCGQHGRLTCIRGLQVAHQIQSVLVDHTCSTVNMMIMITFTKCDNGL